MSIDRQRLSEAVASLPDNAPLEHWIGVVLKAGFADGGDKVSSSVELVFPGSSLAGTKWPQGSRWSWHPVSLAGQSWISKVDGVCGGAARVRDTRLPVSTIVGLRQLGAEDDAILRGYPDLTPSDVKAAFAYYDTHREEIDREIADHESA